MKTSLLLLLCALLASSWALPSAIIAAGSRKHVSSWTLSSETPNPEEEVVLGFALKQQNLKKLDALFWAVSDPKSELYGEYLTSEEIGDLLGDEQTIFTVKNWLEANNAKEIRLSTTKDFIWATLTHADISMLLGVELGVYVYNDYARNQRAIITRSEGTPYVPSEIAAHLDFVSGLWHFPGTDSLFKGRNAASRLAPSTGAYDEYSPLVDPFIMQVEGVPGGIAIYFLPICSMGNQSEVLIDPCSDYDNAIVNYTVVTTQFDYNQNKVVTTKHYLVPNSPNYPNCTIDVSPFGDTLYCLFIVPDLLDDAYVNATFQYCYADGTCTTTVDASGGSVLPVVPSAYHNPNDVREHYGVPANAVGGNKTNSQAVAAFILQFFSPKDLSLFFAAFNLPAYTVQKIVGPNNPPFPGDEASLDIQYIMGIGQGVNTWFWSMGGNAWIAEWAQAVLNTPDAPWVHSISYGESESDVAPLYLNRTEIELQKLGVSGRSVMVASGDDGTGSDCSAALYDISWPASSPHVTSVGATRISRGATPECQANPGGQDCATIGEVSAAYDLGIYWTTGGGFSTAYPVPSYQQAAVNAYLSKASLPPQQLWNRQGRGYPDVSAVGHNLLIVDGGDIQAIDGTSAATPIFAGLVSLLNEARINAEKAPLGFLNPWLYSLNSTAFYDVTVGDTTYCAGQAACCNSSFVAAPGWDPASGLGTPIFLALWKEALALP